MSNAIRTLRATATAGLIAAALMLGPAAAAFAAPGAETPSPAPTTTVSDVVSDAQASPKKQSSGGDASPVKQVFGTYLGPLIGTSIGDAVGGRGAGDGAA
jgi:hypothetical protein